MAQERHGRGGPVTPEVSAVVAQMRESPESFRPEWADVPVLRDYWLEHHVGACAVWPRANHRGLLEAFDEYLEGMGPYDMPAWIPAFEEIRPIVQDILRAEEIDADAEWAGVKAMLDETEVEWRVGDPELADGIAHLIEVAVEMERYPR